MRRPRPRSVWLVLLVAVLLLGAGLGGYFEIRAIRGHHAPAATPSRTIPPELAAATAVPESPPNSAGPAPRPAAVAAVLKSVLADPALGTRLLARVVDVQSGTVLYDRQGATVAAPASTAKLLTATAVLSVHVATDRITTSVLAGRSGTIVLVGGGDPTLTGAPAGKAGAYPDAARISDLAAQLTKQHIVVSEIVVDSTLFTGPAVSPAWDAADVPSEYASAITALMTDGGRETPGARIRSTTPDLAAGHELAAALGKPDLPVARGTAPASAATLATVRSAPIGELVRQMLQPSDNVLAEMLARQVALAVHQPASFDGAIVAVRSVLGGLGVQIGDGLHDGSGLAASDRVSPVALTAVLRLIAGGSRPGLAGIVTSLPVAAWSGTLADRYLPGGSAAAGAGVVRAKTGTLTGVSTLAGLVHDASGRLLAFAFIADQVAPGAGPTADAESALDDVASHLASCGCS
ncbi:MAG: D-alanyl-D-alanine carboxypeptidase/D-alanyl-D-alanine-endopeptidase [Jatrophihabitantaceae bacterium]